MQRVKIAFDRNRDSITEHYLVYRAMNSADPVLAYIVKQPAEENPIYVERDFLTRVGDVFYTTHGNIIQTRDIKVFVNGEQVIPVSINYVDGVIQLDPVPPEGSEVVASYYYDGVEFLDSSVEQSGVTPIAPPAVDYSPPLAVRNIRLSTNMSTGYVGIEYDLPPFTAGTTYRYYVVAADRYGNRSWPSEIGTVILDQALDDVPFIIQKSTDGGTTWEVIGETMELFFEDAPSFAGPMPPPKSAAAEIIPADGEHGGAVLISLEGPDTAVGISGMYRVITRSALGAHSDPSDAVGPIEVPRIAVKYIVRRTNPDGTTVVLGEIASTSFTDSSVEAYQTYTYSISAVDCLGNESEPVTIEVNTDDIVPPDAPEIINVEYS